MQDPQNAVYANDEHEPETAAWTGKPTRREFLKSAGVFTGGFLLTAYLPGGLVFAQEDTGFADAFKLTAQEKTTIKNRKLRIGFNMNARTDDFINSVVAGGQAAAKEYGIQLLVGDANFDAAKQLGDIENLIEQQVDAIFMIAVDANAISPAIEKANQKNIPVIVVGGPPTRGKVSAVLNSTSYQGCLEGTRRLIQEIGGKGNIAVLSIPLALKTIKDRERGSTDAVKGTNVRIVATQPVFSQAEALTAAQNILESNPDLKGIFANWSRAIAGAMQAVSAAKRNVAIVGYDAEVDAMQALKSGRPASPNGLPILRSVIGQQGLAQGRAGVDALCKVLLGTKIPGEILVPTVVVTHTNVDRRWKELYPGRATPWSS